MNASPSQDEHRQVALIILRAAQHLQVGKNKLASFLRGSHSQVIKENELDREWGYGAIFWHNVQTINGFIMQLEEIGLLKTDRVQMGKYSYPIITLSEAGKKVLGEHIEIPLQIRKMTKPITIGDSERATAALFKKGFPPIEIAKRRGLVVSTIFSHFHRLIAVGEISARQCVSDAIIQKVLQAKGLAADKNSLKEIKQLLPEKITYEEIKIVLADRTIQK